MSNESFKNTAHDLNNILTSIINGIERLKNSSKNDDALLLQIAKLETSAKRAVQIIHSQLEPNGKAKKHLEKIDISQIIKEVIEGFKKEEQDKITLLQPESLEKIIADETDLFRIVSNLIKNALEAIDENGNVVIKTSLKKENKGEGIEISIVDNGGGISKENLEKIFQPKFSTKTKGQESGYGLSIVKEKTEEYGGSIRVNSQPGKTEFNVFFPIHKKSKDHSINILLAEDDQSVSEVLADLLTTQGYNVAIASTGNEAINEINNTIFDVLIIDKKMPEMDGIEFIKYVRSKNKEIPIILASGSEVDMQNTEMRNLNVGWVIKKPYNFPEILSALQKFNL